MWGKMTHEVNEKPLQLGANKKAYEKLCSRKTGEERKKLKKRKTGVPKKNKINLTIIAQKLKLNCKTL